MARLNIRQNGQCRSVEKFDHGSLLFDAGTYSLEIRQFGWDGYRFQVNLK